MYNIYTSYEATINAYNEKYILRKRFSFIIQAEYFKISFTSYERNHDSCILDRPAEGGLKRVSRVFEQNVSTGH